MSEYIYGSSLRAAKSKANYLFEGDFRRRPNQNLSGASRSLARGELLQQAAEQRQNREDIRKREQASVKVQSIWRGYYCRKMSGQLMREKFDRTIGDINKQTSKPTERDNFDSLTREFILYYHSKIDEQRLDALIDLILKQPDIFLRLKAQNKSVWLHRLTRLLIMNLTLLDRYLVPAESNHLSFLEVFTRKNHVLDGAQLVAVWRVLIQYNIYTTLRKLADYHNRTVLNSEQSNCNKFSQILIELVRRSLDVVDYGAADEIMPIYQFFNQFLKGPIDSTLDVFYFNELLKLKPNGLKAKYVLPAFANSLCTPNMVSQNPSSTYFSARSSRIPECTSAIWLCYAFVTTIHTQVNQLDDSDKTDYINILSSLLGPAEYITNISLMQIANTEDNFQDDDELVEEADSSSKTNHIFQYYTELNIVITRLVNLINDPSHIDGLKSIIFNSDLQPKVQAAIIRICNLMLAHEPIAIFNCRLLYTVAFSKEFSRSLWRGIVSSTSASLYGANSPIYLQLTRGINVDHNSWDKILPQLRLFCSLYSYLLPTLDDEEFYTDEDKSIFNDDEFLNRLSEKRQHELNNQQTQSKNSKGNTFFIDKELVNISAVLRDICVGFIEILYQDNRYSHHKSSTKSDQSSQDERSKLLQFETKLCFKAIVRLICQLHARDSRKQFCPQGHWICPSVAIPANKAIDFQLVTSQQGRLLSQMTKDDQNHERLVSASNEIVLIKTVLILQEIPFVVSFQDRVQILHQLLRKEKLIHQSEGYHFGLPGTAIQVQIRRNYIYEDAFDKLSVENEPNMKIPLKVSLINAAGVDEAGIDGGGLSKEFLSELLRAGFDPMRGFFKSTRDQLLYPNPSANVLFSTLSEGYEIHYEFLGRMLGKAIFEKIMVELPLAGFFLAKLLARRHSSDVDLHNLASLDPVLYKNLVYLKNYKGDVADLNLDFTISNNELDEHEIVELKPGGGKIPVTRENKIEYVHLVADYRLNKQIRAQCAAFKRGLSQLIDLDWLRMFDPRELQILISGAPTVIDIEDWRRNTIYGNGFTDDCGAINIFWRVASLLDENQKRKLLKFATSCSLPPLLGFKDLVPQFTIAPAEETRLPTASTCMNLLKLPDCEDENTMRSKILYAIESNSGFELS